MTERMGDEQLDREIRGFLAWQAQDVSGAPSATEMANRITDRAGTATAGLRVVPQLAWVLLAGLLVVALLGALASAANQPPPAPALPVSYEAVFLRIEVVGETHAVVVVAVNEEGRERQIARLPGAWAAYDIGVGGEPGEAHVSPGGDEVVYLSPMGAISPTGLLALPSDRGDRPSMMHWEIFDLHEPQREPVVVSGIRHHIDGRGDSYWGPGERLAISWHNDEEGCPDTCVTFVEGRTGASTTVVVQDDLLPYWAADGSGVFVGENPTDPGHVLRPDGTVVEAPLVDAVPSCRTRDASGAELEIEAHDLSEGGWSYSLVREFPDGRREVLSSGRDNYGCLAPDDSAIIYEHELIDPSSRAYEPELIDPRSGARFHPKGLFAGWLGVTR